MARSLNRASASDCAFDDEMVQSARHLEHAGQRHLAGERHVAQVGPRGEVRVERRRSAAASRCRRGRRIPIAPRSAALPASPVRCRQPTAEIHRAAPRDADGRLARVVERQVLRHRCAHGAWRSSASRARHRSGGTARWSLRTRPSRNRGGWPRASAGCSSSAPSTSPITNSPGGIQTSSIVTPSPRSNLRSRAACGGLESYEPVRRSAASPAGVRFWIVGFRTGSRPRWPAAPPA